jgi:alkanesulfonate monooxygenase SsuD/methylene tetrahydromethanopterin reductase-like flavin-dependent oxidoreductase (luciferase family)
MAGAAKLDEDAVRSKIDFVRAEAEKLGRDPHSIEISNFAFTVMLADAPEASRAMREGMAGVLGSTPEAVAKAPMALIGTPEEMVAELRRRAKEWDVREVVLQFQDEGTATRFAREVVPALR